MGHPIHEHELETSHIVRQPELSINEDKSKRRNETEEVLLTSAISNKKEKTKNTFLQLLKNKKQEQLGKCLENMIKPNDEDEIDLFFFRSFAATLKNQKILQKQK